MGAAPGSIIATIMTAHMPPASSASVAPHGPAGAMCIAAMSAISWPRRERESQASRVSPARPSRAATPSRRATASISSSRPTRGRGGGRARTRSAWDAILRFHSPCGSLCGRTITEPGMQTIRIGHSPDPDDAFMFYALTSGKVRIPGVGIEHVLEDIESLNRRARTAELEVTAVSFATYLLVADRYRMMDPGASMGKGYGPILVAREPLDPRAIAEKVVAIPGSHTTAALLLRLYVGDPPLIEVAFDKIPTAVLEGQADVGLLIHEGQITHARMGLVKVLDLGEVWARETGLPLPLGVNVMRRDLGEDVHRRLSQGLRDSIAWAQTNVDEALEYAMRYGRGIDKETCRRFVLMYVNDLTLTLGSEGRAAVERLFGEAQRKGLISEVPPIDPI